MNRDFPTVTIEKDIPISPLSADSGRFSMTSHFVSQIKDMQLGDSFLITAKYSISNSVRNAFKKMNWYCVLRAKRLDNVLYMMRFWRAAYFDVKI